VLAAGDARERCGDQLLQVRERDPDGSLDGSPKAGVRDGDLAVEEPHSAHLGVWARFNLDTLVASFVRACHEQIGEPGGGRQRLFGG
jgi:hypothetical protein